MKTKATPQIRIVESGPRLEIYEGPRRLCIIDDGLPGKDPQSRDTAERIARGLAIVVKHKDNIVEKSLHFSDTLHQIAALIGNVDHSQGDGERSAKMRGDLLNDIRKLALLALEGT